MTTLNIHLKNVLLKIQSFRIVHESTNEIMHTSTLKYMKAIKCSIKDNWILFNTYDEKVPLVKTFKDL